MTHQRAHPDVAGDKDSLGALVHRLSEQIPELVRSEMRLAQAELSQKGRRAGVGMGMFSAAGLLAFFGAASLVTAAIAALALVLPVWASALVVAGVLLLVAGIAALLGRRKVQEATPARPERAMEGVRRDVAVMKGDRT